MTGIFHRPKLALDMARLLLRPTSLESRVRSGLFISGPRQTGKSTFLTQDVVPTLPCSKTLNFEKSGCNMMGASMATIDLARNRAPNPVPEAGLILAGRPGLSLPSVAGLIQVDEGIHHEACRAARIVETEGSCLMVPRSGLRLFGRVPVDWRLFAPR